MWLGLDAFAYDFMQRALMAGVLVALAAGVLGVFVVLRGASMIGDGLGHVAFGGVGLGLLLGVFPFGLAFLFAAAAAVGIQLLNQRGIVLSDTAVAIFYTAGLSLGLVFASLGGGFGDINAYLFGSLLFVQEGEVRLVGVVAAVALVAVVLLYKELVYLTIGEADARAAGLPVGALSVVFAILVATTIIAAARVVGVLLVSALLVLPAASALQVARSYRMAVVASAGLGVLSVATGLWAAFWFNLATGATIALSSVAIFFALLAAKALRRAVAQANRRGAAAG